MAENAVKASEFDEYEFGETAAPEGFDPDAQGYSDPPVGWHVFEVVDFGIRQNKVFNGKDFGQWVGNQIEPRLRIPKGQPDAGASILDFIPLPTPGAQPMPKSLANRWANFMRALGFKLPANQLVPAGFKLHALLGGNAPDQPPTRPYLRLAAEVIEDEYEGKKRLKVKYFGYKTPAELAANGGAAAGKPAHPAKKLPAVTPSAVPPAAADALNLDDL